MEHITLMITILLLIMASVATILFATPMRNLLKKKATKEEYDTLTGKIYPRVCESLYVTSQKNYQVANYDTAVTNLEQVVQMDEGYQDGAAMLLLAQSYEKQGKQDKANTYYQKIIEKYNGTEAATEAQNALDVQNAKKTKDNNN